ncbi:MAG: NAD(P)/FAD-dependent oxidoreductase [Sedimentitalea sp.]
MSAPLYHIETNPDTPAQADVVVIGGGIVGVSAAYYMARRGVSVVLVEKGRIGAEQSSRNWGWCRQQNRDARELPISTKSLALWDDLAGDIGESVGFRRCGLTYFSDDPSELEGWARWRDFAKGEGVTTHMLSGAQAGERGTATGRAWRGGVFSPSDGTADPRVAAPVIAKGVMQHGGIVRQSCAARGIETAAGRVSGVITEHGVIKTATVVMAGGAWASSFLRQQGVRFPQAAVRSSSLALAGDGTGPDALHTADVSITKRGDGGSTLAISGLARVDPTGQQLRFATSFLPMFFKRRAVLRPGGFEAMRNGHERLHGWRLDQPSPMERVRILNPKVDQGQAAEILRRARVLLPELRNHAVTATWAGYIDSTPDGVPAMGETNVPGLVLAAGFSGHGFGIGPGGGHLIADLITSAPPIVDPSPYDPARFAKGTWGNVADF